MIQYDGSYEEAILYTFHFVSFISFNHISSTCTQTPEQYRKR